MYRVRYGRNSWRNRWPWKRLFPPKVDERFCPKCGLPYQNGPQPKELACIPRGSVQALVYPAGGWKRDEIVVRFGKCKAIGSDIRYSEYYLVGDLDDLVETATLARKYDGKRKRSARR